jgi:hypothetical protein
MPAPEIRTFTELQDGRRSATGSISARRAYHLQHETGDMRRALAASAMLLVGTAAECPASDPASRAEVLRFIRPLGFGEADLAAAEGGRIVTRSLQDSACDLAFGALLYVRAPMDRLMSRPLETRAFLTVGEPLQFGLLGDPPRLADLDALRFDRKELRAARGCRPRDCSMKLGRPAMERLERWKSASRSSDSDRRLAGLLRESILDEVTAYREEGRLPVYLDKDEPISVAEELRASVEGSPYVDGGSPFLAYVMDYPNAILDGTRDFFYWSCEEMRRPIVSVHHLAIQREPDGGVVRYAIADKHLSDNHYFRARLELLWLLDGTDPSGFYAVRLSRARIDPPGWFADIAMGRIRRKTRSSLERQLRAARDRVEAAALVGATVPRAPRKRE